MDFIISIGSFVVGIVVSWLITHYYHKKTQEEYRKQKIVDKLESLHKDIEFAYKTKDEKERKDRLINISYTSIQHQGLLLGNSIGDLQDILFKNSDNKEEIMVEITQVFKRHFPECFN